MNLRLISLVVVLVLLAGNASLTGQETIKDSEYYPLKVGSKWTYVAGGEKKITVTVAKHEKLGEVMCARLETAVDGKVVGAEHIALGKDGLFRHSVFGLTADPPVLFLKLPPKKGETWKVETKVGGLAVTGTYTSDEAEITVPAGKYKTVVARTDDFTAGDQKLEITTYFAKGIGMVKSVNKIGGNDVVLELEKFEPAK